MGFRHILQPVQQTDDIYHLPFRTFQPPVSIRISARTIIPAVMSQRCWCIETGRRTLREADMPQDRMHLRHFVFLCKPLPSRLGIHIKEIDLACIMKYPAVPCIFQHFPTLFLRIFQDPDLLNIIKVIRFFRYNDPAQNRCRSGHNIRLDIEIRCKPHQQLHQKSAIRNTMLGLHKTDGQLPEI